MTATAAAHEAHEVKAGEVEVDRTSDEYLAGLGVARALTRADHAPTTRIDAEIDRVLDARLARGRS